MNLAEQILPSLVAAGWNVRPLATRVALPPVVAQRYHWAPAEYVALIESAELICSPGDHAWIVTTTDFSGASESAFAWNEWELQSLNEVTAESEARAITEFWDNHLPVLMSVKSGYAHISIEKDGLRVVQGEEPMYEDVSVITSSVDELFQMILSGDARLQARI
jgi:hypothetical protein